MGKGKYKVIINCSYKFNRRLPLLLDVPNRMAIRIQRQHSKGHARVYSCRDKRQD
ncbi:hypothetical protein [Candidatus Endomicrobiellum devescovinae]|uniref:hypothetical protein n=1 Tax=Candidatus Endomicrobiellum devescovinae TaxID=3242322 RepID=UPI002838CE3E|nr:hypothetical protein [Endomicrobium sp.]